MRNTNLIIGTYGHVASINPISGKEVWRTKLVVEGRKWFSSLGMQPVSIIEDDGVIYAGCYGHLFALDAISGRIKWHNELKGLGFSTIAMNFKGKSSTVQQSYSGM
ncbi:MAG: PQQ-binding-like beta-propeller repeat protein [Bacteroidota bacterium]